MRRSALLPLQTVTYSEMVTAVKEDLSGDRNSKGVEPLMSFWWRTIYKLFCRRYNLVSKM